MQVDETMALFITEATMRCWICRMMGPNGTQQTPLTYNRVSWESIILRKVMA